MSFYSMAIERPYGISVFGSHTLWVEPDVALLQFSLSRLKPKPRDALREVRDSAQKVQIYLRQAAVPDVGVSRIEMNESYQTRAGERIHEGYKARVAFRVLVRDLACVEDILLGVIELGVSDLWPVAFMTTRLKEFRAEARVQAVRAAREKAEIYCRAAGVGLGPVLHIQDVNPNQLQAMRHDQKGVDTEADSLPAAFSPSNIAVSGTVMVAYELIKM